MRRQGEHYFANKMKHYPVNGFNDDEYQHWGKQAPEKGVCLSFPEGAFERQSFKEAC